MYQYLIDIEKTEEAARRIKELLEAHREWFYSESGSADAPLLLRSDECDVRVLHGRLIFFCWGNCGQSNWRIFGWKRTGDNLLLEAGRRTGSVRAVLKLIPRASASAIAATVSAARRARCERLAALASEMLPSARVLRVGLSAGPRSGQPGRYARIQLSAPRALIAVTSIVADEVRGDVDAFLSSALIWLARLNERARTRDEQKLWLVVQAELAWEVKRRVALLRDGLRRAISLYELDQDWEELKPLPQLELEELWNEKLPPFPPVRPVTESEWASRIIALAPAEIDLVRARRGETLRFQGLPFARVRRLMNSEQVWFGIEGGRRRLLEEDVLDDWTSLIEELKAHRRADASDHRHAFYRAAPESWLESLLRRDITRLDPGLRLAPLHAQFRTSHAGSTGTRSLDLLALRRDGRLVVIELKVSEDREHALQGADYWRRVEAHRRAGHISRAQLFGDLLIEDAPPLVYLVAPLLRFHRAFNMLARAVRPEIEMYRFDLNENWRSGVRVVRRARLNQSQG
ncbi:MAG TPA: hypothetical protein VGB17_10735 [Pyrinomonadaceae bacterium]|jgi:hypothetical protein